MTDNCNCNLQVGSIVTGTINAPDTNSTHSIEYRYCSPLNPSQMPAQIISVYL